MDKQEYKEYAVIHCRVSSLKQTDGDSFELQEMEGRALAKAHVWGVPENYVFKWAHSGRKKERHDFNAVLDFIRAEKKKGVPLKYYICKSLDRFTRAGFEEYNKMKGALEALDVQLVDTTGIVQPKRNVLENLGNFVYDWSMRSPSEKAEHDAVQDSKQEAVNIIIRLVSAEIALAQQGYLTRRAADGFVIQKIYDQNGKRKNIGVPDPERAKFYIEMFRLRAAGNFSDEEIVEQINAMGFLSKPQRKWHRAQGSARIVGRTTGKPLTVKQLQRIVQKPIYAGIVCEKWTHDLPIKAQFDGLVSLETFNRANRGKLVIKDLGDNTFELLRDQKIYKRLRYNPDYPFKFIPCDICKRDMLGSASRSKSGKYVPAYHCGGLKKGPREHPYYGIPKAEFEARVKHFVDHLEFSSAFLSSFEETLLRTYWKREAEILQQSVDVHRTIADLQTELRAKAEAFTHAGSPILRNLLQEQVDELDNRISQAKSHRNKLEIDEQDIRAFIREVRYTMEHPSELLLNGENIQEQLAMWDLVFESRPTYAEIVNGTPKYSLVFRLSEDFKREKTNLVTPRGIEPRFDP